MVEQGIQQGAVLMAGSRMDHQAGGLVNHQDVLVLVDDFQLDVLCEPLALGFLLGLQDQLRAAVDDVARAQHGAVDGQATVLIQPARRERECSGKSWAAIWSRRWPPSSNGTSAAR